MGNETVPSWALDTPSVAAATPSWALDTSARSPERFAEATQRQREVSANNADPLAILQTEFKDAQKRLTDAVASKDIDSVNRYKDDLAGLSREILKLKGVPPDINGESPINAKNETPIVDRISQLPLPAQAAITGVLGAKAAGTAAAIPYGTYRGEKAAIEFAGSLLDKIRSNKLPDLVSRIEPTLTENVGGAKGNQRAAAGWLGGRTGDLAAVPEALSNTVTTLKGYGAGSASNIEAQNALGVQKQLAVGAPLETWRPAEGGQILVNTVPTGGGGARTFTAPSIQQQARGSTQLTPQIGGKPAIPKSPAPVVPAPVAVPEGIPSSFKRAVEYAKAVAKNPIAKAMTVGGSLGAAIPYAAVDWMRGDYEGAMKKMGIGAGVGATLALAPVAGKVLPPLAALAQGYDFGQRTQAKDYTGAALSAAGGLGALATMAPKMVSPAASMGVAIAAPLVNLGRDWLREHPGELGRWMAQQGDNYVDVMSNPY